MTWLTGVFVAVWNILPATVQAGAVGICSVLTEIASAAKTTTL